MNYNSLKGHLVKSLLDDIVLENIDHVHLVRANILVMDHFLKLG